MVREIVHIDEEKCNGCGECIPSCHEGAIALVDGKARLIKDSLCDGLGACLGECPQDAIRIERRDADAFVDPNVAPAGGCPGSRAVELAPQAAGGCPGSRAMAFSGGSDAGSGAAAAARSALTHWPVQLHLVSPAAPFFRGQNVLLSADCVAYAAADFHRHLLEGKKLAIACPKLDEGQQIYLDKLVALIDEALIDTLTVARMEVPCCGGLVALALEAASRAERKIPVKEVVISVQGEVLSERWVAS